MLNGDDSSFDTDGVYAPSPTIFSTDNALQAVQDLYVRIPRLVRLTRSALHRHIDEDATAEAVQVAQTLYASPLETCIRQSLANELSTRLAISGLVPAVVGSYCFDFETLESYVLATQYYAYRILLCGLIESLCTLNDAKGMFILQDVREADVTAATSVAMFIEYALGSSKPHPVRALRLQLPLQVAFGAWDRLQKRQVTSAGFEYDKAIHMKRWSMEMLGKIDDIWGILRTDRGLKESSCEMAAGGPRTGDMEAWRDCR